MVVVPYLWSSFYVISWSQMNISNLNICLDFFHFNDLSKIMKKSKLSLIHVNHNCNNLESPYPDRKFICNWWSQCELQQQKNREILDDTLVVDMLRNENTQLNYCACTSLLGKCRLSLYSIQVAQPATTSPSFLIMKGLGVKLLPPGWDVSPSQGFNPQHFIWGFPDDLSVPIYTPAQEHKTMIQPGLKPRPLNPEYSSLSLVPPHPCG